MRLPSHSFRFDHPNNIWWGVNEEDGWIMLWVFSTHSRDVVHDDTCSSTKRKCNVCAAIWYAWNVIYRSKQYV
jgi:hypothetical protein